MDLPLLPIGDHPDVMHVKEIQEEFGRACADEILPRQIASLIIGPTPDGKNFVCVVGTVAGDSFTFSFGIETYNNVLGALIIALRSVEEYKLLQDQPAGKS